VSNLKNLHKLSAAGLLISLGIIYGDIGTSPLYVFKAIVADRVITSDLILGGLSCIFWTLTLQTTIKYVIITLRAENKGEGGILSLFSLVKKKGKWLVIPAMIGGSALLADGMITPPITVSAAVEGLRIFYADIPTVPIVIAIISLLFLIQQFGTFIVGKAFGPIMFLWFTMMAVLGGFYLIQYPEILKAINPYYAYVLLSTNPNALFILGAVFLCTTGAEALYSDLGHCGRSNIRISWIYVKTCLLLNYFGQGVWLWQHQGSSLGPGENPFFSIMPEWFLIAGISIATAAAIIASQAMISGSFTLISEAVRLNLWPKVKINYPSNQKGQLYVPSINILLWIGCIVVVLIFRESQNMEGAYGLAINLTFLMTTILVAVFLKRKKFPNYIIIIFVTIYGLIEVGFLVANMAKFLHGGWFTILLASFLLSIMWAWFSARKIKNRFVKFVEVDSYYPILKELSEDESVPKYASQLVYLTSSNFNSEIESKIMYSILQKQPKRADVYWLVHVDVTDEPFTRDYKVEFLIPNKLIRIDFKLGFRVEQQINVLFRKVVEELVRNNEVDIISKYTSLNKYKIIGDFRFVVLDKVLSKANVLSFVDRFIMDYYFILKKFSLSEERGFGLDVSFVTIERVPLIISTQDTSELKRVDLHHDHDH
jgi:KUP system potassium uptake protein